MTLFETFSICFDRLPSKRKLDDYTEGAAAGDGDGVGYDDASELASCCRTRLLEDDSEARAENTPRCAPTTTALVEVANSASSRGKAVDYASSSACSSYAAGYGVFDRGESSRSNSGASEVTQFYVIIDGKSVTFRLNRKESILRVHEKLQSLTGMKVMDQRLIYRGKQLQSEHTLEECSVEKDSNLYLVSRMRSTRYPRAFQVTEEIVLTTLNACKSPYSLPMMLKSVKSKVEEFVAGATNQEIPQNDMYTVDDEEQDQHLASMSTKLWVIDYLKVFLDYEAPKALVALYMSSVKANRECADECIQRFIGMADSFTIGPVKSFFATALLEFCRLLMPSSNHDSGDDLLYLHCRSTLGSVVRIVGLARGTFEVDKSKFFMTVQDILPFLREVVDRLKKDLALSIESNGSHGPLFRHVSDFSSFLQPLLILVRGEVAYRGPVSAPADKGKCSLRPYGDETKQLFLIFSDIFGWMERCLAKMEKHAAMKGKAVKKIFLFGWSQYLAILKELSSIAELYQGFENLFWDMMTCRKAAVQALVLRFVNRGDDCNWLFPHKDILDFESRRHLVSLMFPEVKEDYDELHEMLIDRSQLLAESFEYISKAAPSSLQAGLFIEFKNEEATGPGVLREWFLLVSQAIFNPERALFVACPLDRRRFFPNPASKVNPLHLEYFRFSGRVVALALMHKVQIGIVLDRVFFVQLAERKVCLEDIRDADPYIYSSCKQILEMDPEFIDSDALGLTFVREFEVLGSREVVELCQGGKQIVVNSKNRHSYVDLLIQHCFVKSISAQVTNFARGFADIVSSAALQASFFQCLELEDLDGVLHGSRFAVPVEDWKLHTEYDGYKMSDPQITWFWEVVGEMSDEQRKVLLFFWTSVKYLPVEGFHGLSSRLYIYKSMDSCDHLPSSHTCFFRLCIPLYPSKEMMRERLEVVTKEHVGCSFGTW